jgi:hypothetical protein
MFTDFLRHKPNVFVLSGLIVSYLDILQGISTPEGEVTVLPRNVGFWLLNDAASYPTGTESAASLAWDQH